jgi:bisphosphoglycerate-independent phosphoglycerate mutase (AlkP superfamily)
VSTVPGVCLVILDGWGLAPEGPGNAISLAEGVRLDGEGILADVAPTVLALLGIEQPEEMTGRSLLAAGE